MPELPEIEVLRREIEREIVGKKVKKSELSSLGSTSHHPNKKHFSSRIDGAKVTKVQRRGTWLLLSLDNEHILVIKLGKGAKLIRTTSRNKPEDGTEITLTFTQHGQLRLVDPKKKSEVFIVPDEELVETLPELADYGADPVDNPMSWTTFGEALLRRDGKLKSLLMDSTFITGVGPVYSDEILFSAGLRYDRAAASLSSQEIRRLYRALVETLHDAIKYRGASIGEQPFVDLHGEQGEYQEHLNVYGREGEMSPRARGPIVKTRFGNTYTYYCEQTQV